MIKEINNIKQSNFMRMSIIVAIIIIMNLFLNYVVTIVYKEPVMDFYSQKTQVVKPISNKGECISIGGQWNEVNDIPSSTNLDNPKLNGLLSNSYCNPNYTNQLNYEIARKVYERKVFITLVSAGVISLVLAGFIGVSILAIAFAWGGVLSLIIASIRYWSQADNLAKVVILALALGILMWLAVKKFNNE